MKEDTKYWIMVVVIFIIWVVVMTLDYNYQVVQ